MKVLSKKLPVVQTTVVQTGDEVIFERKKAVILWLNDDGTCAVKFTEKYSHVPSKLRIPTANLTLIPKAKSYEGRFVGGYSTLQSW